MVINSKRPNIMTIANSHFAVAGSKIKLLSGPIKCPNPGPTFAIDVKVPDNAVKISKPVNDNPMAQMIVVKKKMVMKDITLNIISSVTGLSSYLGKITACGDTIKVKCLFNVRAKIEKRKTLIPPVVDPVHPPIGSKKKKNKTKKGPHRA